MYTTLTEYSERMYLKCTCLVICRRDLEERDVLTSVKKIYITAVQRIWLKC